MTPSHAAIFGYRLRFSPETQAIRQSVADHIVLRNLRTSSHPRGESVGHLNVLDADGKRVVVLGLTETTAALARVTERDLAEERPWRAKKRWRLTEKGRAKLEEDEAQAASIVQRCARMLFDEHPEIDRLAAALVAGLATIFDDLARTYLRLITEGAGTGAPAVAPDKIRTTVLDLEERFSISDRRALELGLKRFFEERNPDFDAIKWMFCKNYYLVRAMGVGAETDVLSSSLFSSSEFYLDTNVLLVALDSTSPHYAAVRQIISGLHRIGARLRVLRITVDEMRSVAKNQQRDLEKVLQQIPDALLPKVTGLVARIEARHRVDSTQPSPRTILQQLEESESRIRDDLGFEIIDDAWFDEASSREELLAYAEHLRAHYDSFVKSRRRKGASAAFHDALALRWIAEQTSGDSYFLTLDTSLPTSGKYRGATQGNRGSAAFSAYGLLPWLGVTGEDDELLSESYSALLSAQLLAAGINFSLHEFRILAEVELECEKLPADDVEQCLLHLRREASHLDLAKAEDREHLSGILKGFFASPDRKYVAEVGALREELESAKTNLERSEQRREHEVERIGSDIRRLEAINRRERAKNRVLLGAMVYLVLLGISVILADSYGSGENLLQRIGDSVWLFGIATFVGLSTIRLLCRGELWEETKGILGSFGQE